MKFFICIVIMWSLILGRHSADLDVHEDGMGSSDWWICGCHGRAHSVLGGQRHVQHAEKSHGMYRKGYSTRVDYKPGYNLLSSIFEWKLLFYSISIVIW